MLLTAAARLVVRLLFLLLLTGGYTSLFAQAKPDTLVRLDTIHIPYANIKQRVVLYKCLPAGKYLIDVGEGDVDCNRNNIVSTMSANDFDDIVKQCFNARLILSPEPYLNAHLTDSLFGSGDFKVFLKEFVYDPCIAIVSSDQKSQDNKASSKKAAAGKKKADSTLIPDITLLNAANFDFTGKLSATYLAKFNIFAPNLDNGFGFVAGIQKINYSTVALNGGDSNSVQYYQQNYLANPLMVNRAADTVLRGAKYVQEYNQYTFSTTNKVWSIYFDPMYKVVGFRQDFPNDGLYVHLHAELMINQWTQTSVIKNLYTNPDTCVAVAPHDSSFYWVKTSPIVVKKNFLTGNFGAGLMYYHHLGMRSNDTSMHFFGQATLGWSVNAPDFDLLNNPTQPPHPNGTLRDTNPFIYETAKFFFLTRFEFAKYLSSSSELFVGFEGRGILSSPNVQYAVYLGLNVDVSKLAGLIGGGD